jgi:hypothetical protein
MGAFVPLEEVLQRGRHLISFSAARGQLVGDIFADVPRPAFSRVEGDDACRIMILSIEQVCHQRQAFGVILGLAEKGAKIV